MNYEVCKRAYKPHRKRVVLAEPEVLALIVQGNDARSIIEDNIPDAEKRFKKVDKALRDYLAYVRKTFPDAEYYTGSGGFHLLLGHSHDDSHGTKAQQQLVAFAGLASIGDGDW